MAQYVYMPKFGATMTQGEVVQWFIKEGDSITRGQIIAEIMTDKVTNEIAALVSGEVEKIVVAEGEIAEVGKILAILKD